MNWWHRLLVAMTGGGLGALAFQPECAVVAWVFPFAAWSLLWLAVKGAGFRLGVLCGVVFGMVLYPLSVMWFVRIFGPAAVALWMVLALFSGLAAGIGGWLSRRAPGAWWMPAAVAAVWIGVEFYRCEWFFLRFPWVTPGVGVGPSWLSPLIGVYGAGFLVVLVPALFVLSDRRRPSAVGLRMAGTILAALVAVLLVMRPGPVGEGAPEKAVPVLLVQSEVCRFERYLELSRESGFRDGLVVWPEYSVPWDIERHGDLEFPRLKEWVAEQKVVAVLGTQEELDEGHYNSALTLDGSGVLGRHAKCRPVHLMNDGTAGERTEPVATRFGAVATPICFDCDYTRVVRAMTAAGAEWFAVPSMDPEPWGARQHWQHAELFRHRAAENGRWFAVASTSGSTRLIDPHGVVREELPLFDEGVLAVTVWPEQRMTLFTRVGWLTPWVLSGLALIGVAAGITVGRQGRVLGAA